KTKKRRFKLPSIKSVPAGLKELLTNKALLSKILMTLFIILIYRAMASIPLPGVDMGVYEQYFQNATASEANYLFLIFTGNTLDTPSIVGLGIVAYINASIIIQLITPVIPYLTELSKEGARGQQIINQYTRYLTLPLSVMYSVVYLLFLSRRDLSSSSLGTITDSPDFLIPHAAGSDWPSVTKIIFMALILTAGSMFLMWLAEVITENGIGNGSSIMISTGILASLPSLLKQDFAQISFPNFFTQLFEGNFSVLTNASIVSLFGVLLGFILLIILIVYINESVRKIKIHYARRAATTPVSQDSNLPIKLTITGVLPIIFASALVSVPQLVIPFARQAISSSSSIYGILGDIENSFLFATRDGVVNGKDLTYGIFYFIIIVLFGVFYAFIALKPSDTAENLQKSSAFIPGVRPGKSTEKYIARVLARIGFWGAVFLAFLALLPLVARNYIEYSSGINLFILSGVGGTSILIIVSVILDTVRQFNSMRVSRSYERYA
ncbi:preprotein translocase subunit SecY, partial [Candidatus Dojkabacteria bacterium]|nr:preprotein translocase subunit SecY [Candidatus Dojkabacteria bacterium]